MPDAAATAFDDRRMDGRALLRAADSRMAALVDAESELNPDVLFEAASISSTCGASTTMLLARSSRRSKAWAVSLPTAC